MSLKPIMLPRQVIIATLLWISDDSIFSSSFNPAETSATVTDRCRQKDLEDTLRTLTRDSLEAALRAYKAATAQTLEKSREVRERVEKISAMQKDLGTEEMTRRVKAVVEMALERQKEGLETEVA
jgi:hypothetical protein